MVVLVGARPDEPEAPPEPPDCGRFAAVLAEAVFERDTNYYISCQKRCFC